LHNFREAEVKRNIALWEAVKTMVNSKKADRSEIYSTMSMIAEEFQHEISYLGD